MVGLADGGWTRWWWVDSLVGAGDLAGGRVLVVVDDDLAGGCRSLVGARRRRGYRSR